MPMTLYLDEQQQLTSGLRNGAAAARARGVVCSNYQAPSDRTSPSELCYFVTAKIQNWFNHFTFSSRIKCRLVPSTKLQKHLQTLSVKFEISNAQPVTIVYHSSMYSLGVVDQCFGGNSTFCKHNSKLATLRFVSFCNCSRDNFANCITLSKLKNSQQILNY